MYRGGECIGGRMYRGENQEQYICPFDQKQILICLVGEYSPECLKRVFFGDPCLKEKGHGMLLEYKDMEKNNVLYTGKNV